MEWHSFCLGVLAVSLYLGLGLWLALPLVALAVVLTELLVAAAFPSSAKYNGARRKMTVGTWSDPSDPCIYAELDIDARRIPTFLEEASKQASEKITVTHLVVKAVARTLKHAPALRGRLVFSRYVPFETTDISCLVVMEKSDNLAVHTVRDADKLPLQGIAAKIRTAANTLRSEKDPDFEKTVKSQHTLPVCVLRPVAWLAGYLANAIGIDVSPLGAKRFHFGCCMVTSLGSIGVEKAIVPMTPFARVPVLISVGLLKTVPICEGEGEDAKVVPRLTLPLNLTLDPQSFSLLDEEANGGRAQ